jgi:hypothetical protein
MDFGGSIKMTFSGNGVTGTSSHLCRVEVRGGETQEVCICRTINRKRRANLSYETAVAEFLLAADDSDDDSATDIGMQRSWLLMAEHGFVTVCIFS